jgi:preprotein translocase subunit SecG
VSHILTNISSIALLIVGLLLIFAILLQRGRGGGLAGAFGGAGGQSAFGTKAGDVFTRITIGIAIAWVALAVLTGYAMASESGAPKFPSSPVNLEKAVDGTRVIATYRSVECRRPIIDAPAIATPSAEGVS